MTSRRITRSGTALPPRNRDGFALPGTLAVLLLSSVLVTALLGLTFSSNTLSNDQLNRDSETRAADAAVQTAIGRIARDAAGTTGSLLDSDLCNWLPEAGETNADRPTMVVNANDEDVEITCEAESPDVYVPEEEVADRVLVVGEYEGAPAGSPDRLTATQWRSTSAPGSPCLITDTSCFPWREAANAADSSSLQPSPTIDSLMANLGNANTKASIAHTGVDPLRFIGDVQAKHGAAAVRNERDCDPAVPGSCPFLNDGPGLTASGSYVQGALGPMANVAPVPPDDCGVLRKAPSDAVRPYQLKAAQVNAIEGIACNSGGAASLDPITARLSRPAGLQWTAAQVGSQLAATPTNAAGGQVAWTAACPPGSPLAARLVRLSPGSYPKDRTETLNRWFANCSNYVFHFLPGNYWFDVDRAGAFYADGGPLASERHAIVMDNANNRIVFGAPRGWSTYQNISSVAQPLCDANQTGVSITLSARTSIVHRRGAASICGVPPGSAGAQPQATIWQDSAPDLGVSETVVAAEGGIATTGFYFPNGLSFGVVWNWLFNGQPLGSTNFSQTLTDPNTGQPTTTVPFRLEGPCFVLNPFCDGEVTFGARFSPEEGTQITDGTLNKAVLTVTANSNGANGGASRTYVDLYMPDRPNAVACRMQYPRIPEGMNGAGPLTIGYDLMNPRYGNCASVLGAPDIGRQSLLDAVAVVKYDLDHECCGNYWVQVDDIKLRTGWSPAPAGTAACSMPTGGRLRNECRNAPAVVDPASPQWSEIRINRQAVTIPRILFIPSWELRYWPSGDTTVTYNLPTLDDRFNPNLATDPGATLTAAGVMLEGRSRCSIIGIDCGAYGIANRDNAGLTVRLTNPNGSTYCQTTFRRLPEWGETRYLDLLKAPGGSIQGGDCHAVLNGKRNGDLLGKSLRVDLNLKPRVPCLPPSNNSGILDILAAVGTGSGLLCNWWGYDVGRIDMLTASAGVNPSAMYSGPRTPMRVTSDSSSAQNASFVLVGPLSTPGNDLDVRWSGPSPQGTMFSGYSQNMGNAVTTMVVRGIGSDTLPSAAGVEPDTRILCCFDARAGERIVELKAWIGRESGEDFEPDHLRTIAKVRIIDRVPIPDDGDPLPDPGEPQPGTYQPANRVIVDDWQVCTRGNDEYDCRIV